MVDANGPEKLDVPVQLLGEKDADGGGRWRGSLEDAAVLAVKMGSEAVDQRHRQSLAPGKGSSLSGNQPSDAFPSAP